MGVSLNTWFLPLTPTPLPRCGEREHDWLRLRRAVRIHMSHQRLAVVVSRTPEADSSVQELEEAVVAALSMEPLLDVSIIPYLYDLDSQHPGRQCLESIQGDMAVLVCMYPRAAFWLLNRDGIKGHFGESHAKSAAVEEHANGEPRTLPPNSSHQQTGKDIDRKGIGSLDVPDRHIYCLDFRAFTNPKPCLQEILRIAEECRQRRGTTRMVMRWSRVQDPLHSQAAASSPLQRLATAAGIR